MNIRKWVLVKGVQQHGAHGSARAVQSTGGVRRDHALDVRHLGGRQRRPAQHMIRDLLARHDRRRIEIAIGNRRKNRRVNKSRPSIDFPFPAGDLIP